MEELFGTTLYTSLKKKKTCFQNPKLVKNINYILLSFRFKYQLLYLSK